MTSNHPGNRKYKVTVLRTDGTPWIIEHCKHVLFKVPGVFEIYWGEHNVDRKLILLPASHVDHIYVEEENPGASNDNR